MNDSSEIEYQIFLRILDLGPIDPAQLPFPSGSSLVTCLPAVALAKEGHWSTSDISE
jgi:hypothetical protein